MLHEIRAIEHDIATVVAIVVYGPKAVGKTWIARVLEDRLDVRYVNADELIPRLQSQGREAHPTFGWLDPVVDTVVRTAQGWDAVSIEATGAWPSDWELPERLAAAGLMVKKNGCGPPWRRPSIDPMREQFRSHFLAKTWRSSTSEPPQRRDPALLMPRSTRATGYLPKR